MDDKWYTEGFDASCDVATWRMFAPDVVAPIRQWLTRPVTKLLLLGPAERLTRVAGRLREQFGREISLVQTEHDLIQVMNSKAGKAKALRFVTERLSRARKDVLAIGDNANDVAMLQWAGVGVAVANARELVLQIADYVAADNDTEGVAAAVAQLVLDGRFPSESLARLL